jgi:L-lactate utilization protein LutB
MPITITEALADIKTTAKRIEKKREFILNYLARPDGVKDPLEKDGGSAEAIKREEQAVGDLEARVISLRRGISLANDRTTVEIAGMSRTISDWLTWRREVAPKRKEFLARVRSTVQTLRQQATKQGFQTLQPGQTATQPNDMVVNVSEQALAVDIERIETVLGELDGRLSLHNATVQIIEG